MRLYRHGLTVGSLVEQGLCALYRNQSKMRQAYKFIGLGAVGLMFEVKVRLLSLGFYMFDQTTMLSWSGIKHNKSGSLEQ